MMTCWMESLRNRRSKIRDGCKNNCCHFLSVTDGRGQRFVSGIPLIASISGPLILLDFKGSRRGFRGLGTRHQAIPESVRMTDVYFTTIPQHRTIWANLIYSRMLS